MLNWPPQKKAQCLPRNLNRPSWFGQCISQKVENAHLHTSTKSHIWGRSPGRSACWSSLLAREPRELAPWWNHRMKLTIVFWMLSEFEVWNIDINGDVENWHGSIESFKRMKQRFAGNMLLPSIHRSNFKASPCQCSQMAHQTTSILCASLTDGVDWGKRFILLSVILCNIMNHQTLLAGKTPEAPHRWWWPLQLLSWSHAGWTASAGWKNWKFWQLSTLRLCHFTNKSNFTWMSSFSSTLETNKSATPEWVDIAKALYKPVRPT